MARNNSIIRINDLACFIRSHKLGKNIALIAYSDENKQWVAEFLGQGPISAQTLMEIAKFVHKQNTTDGIALAV